MNQRANEEQNNAAEHTVAEKSEPTERETGMEVTDDGIRNGENSETGTVDDGSRVEDSRAQGAEGATPVAGNNEVAESGTGTAAVWKRQQAGR